MNALYSSAAYFIGLFTTVMAPVLNVFFGLGSLTAAVGGNVLGAMVDWLSDWLTVWYGYALERFPELDQWTGQVTTLIGAVRTLQGSLGYVAHFFSLSLWGSEIIAAFSLIMAIRAARWALALIPTLNLGG